jgi:hypothetical protein
MRQKSQVYTFWGALKKYAEEKDKSYSAALNELLAAYTARFYMLEPPRQYLEDLLREAVEYEEKYG